MGSKTNRPYQRQLRLWQTCGDISNWKILSFVLLCSMFVQFAAAGTFSDKLSEVLRKPSQHGKKVAPWNPDPVTKQRIRRALEDTTPDGVDDDYDYNDADYAPNSHECHEYQDYDFRDLFKISYLGPVCEIIDARGDASKMKDLENCTIVNGFVQLVFMHDLTEEELKLYRFPKLRVITHYLLVFRMYNLRTLRYMFPNLAVIGGLELFKDYSLVLYENPHMTEIGLGNLQFINKGGVRIQKNSNLCYLNTIEWERLGTYSSNPELEQGKVVTLDNRDSDQCVDQCGADSGCEKVSGRETCWGLKLCQKRASTEIPCGKEMCECHEQCLAGCTKPDDAAACIACKDKYHNGTCVSECPIGTYRIHGWLCIKSEECGILKWHIFENVCQYQCPSGYQVEMEGCIRVCKKCILTDCGKVCPGDFRITDTNSLLDVEVCREIEGALTISINGGSDVVERLDDAFRDLEVIGSLIVRRSFPLISLSFLKNVRHITGRNMEHDMYSFYILENQNLKELWNFTTHNLTIDAGKAFFHFNPHLCMAEVNKVRGLTPIRGDAEDISETTNGDKATCNFTKIDVLDIQMFSDEPFVNIYWKNIVVKDDRTLIGYRVFYKESPKQDAKKNEGVDACRLNSWTIVDKTKTQNSFSKISTNSSAIEQFTEPKNPGNTSKLLSNLKAYTQYAFYIHAYTTSTAKNGADSDIKYFTTRPAEPNQPRNLRATGTTTSSINVVWDPPSTPNGNITHYVVEWRRQREEDLDSVRSIDTCTYSSFSKPPVSKGPTTPKPIYPETPVDKSKTTETLDCSKCEENHISKKDEQEARESTEFENYLQNEIFFVDPEHNIEQDFFASDIRDNSSALRFKRSLNRFRRQSINVSSITNTSNSSTAPTTTAAPNTETVTPTPEDPEYLWKRVVVEDTKVTFSGLHHYSDYDIHVYACNHASDPRSKNDLSFQIREPHFISNYTKCSIEAITMKRTSPNKTVDTIPSQMQVAPQNQGRTEETTRLIWKMPTDPNAYIKSFTIQINRTDSGNKKVSKEICVHVNTSIRDIMSYDLSVHSGLVPGSYLARVRPISLAGEGSWTEPVQLEISDSSTQGTSTTYMIVAALVIVIVAICCIVGICYCKNKKKQYNPHDIYMDPNPEYARHVYVPDEYEIDIEKVTILEEIGHGNFGKVFAGLAKFVVKGQEETRVAIKKLHENAPPSRRFEFLKEASTMKAFNAHHVVRLLAVVSKSTDPLVIMEFMEKGDLKSYLRSRREAVEENSLVLFAPTLQEKLQMAAEIADGMAYLAAYKFVHRDLAARNCLVTEQGTVKIGDFGLTRDIYETDYYRKESRGFLPIRWMAPESLKDGVFDSRSDVWSYGVVLWELATLAEQPYQGQQHDEVTRFVIDGGYMGKPKNCPKRLYDLMTTCWLYNPKMRPHFIEIVQELYVDVNDEFKEVCFFGKHQDVGSADEDEGQFLLAREHSEGIDVNYSSSDVHVVSPNGQPFPENSWNAGEPSFQYSKNSTRSGRTPTAPHHAESEEKRGLLMPERHSEDCSQSGESRSPNTTSTTATPTSTEKRLRRNRSSSESLYENGYEERLTPLKTTPSLRDQNSEQLFNRTPKSDPLRDPLLSFKHLNGGHKTKNVELDMESGVDAGSHGDNSSGSSRSNLSTPDETHVILGNDTTVFPLLPTSNSC